MANMNNNAENLATSSLNEQNEVITDDSEILPAFCQSLEAILCQGLKKGLGVIGLADRDYWNCIEGLTKSSKVYIRIPPTIAHIISVVQQCKKVDTSLGRGRLFLRIALTKGVLVQALQALVENQDYVRYWYKDFSVLVDYQQKGVVLDILKALKKKSYKLDVNNCSFLSESWLAPVVERFEFVPAASLGMTLFAIDGKSMVINVRQDSSGDERGIEPGDCLDELFGQTINEKWSTRIADLKRKYKGKPITATVVKGRFHDGRWFLPLYRRFNLLCQMGKCSPLPAIRQQPNENKQRNDNKGHVRAAFPVTYLGCTDVGKNGSCIFVQDGIKKLNPDEYEKIRLKLQLMERDILLTHAEGNETFTRYSYTETSSCALRDDDRTQFGFIVGDTTCSFAEKFVCHVFVCESIVVAKQIIEGIGKGFDRTVYCV